MATLSKRPNSPYWFANFIGTNKRRTSRSTKQLIDDGRNSLKSMAATQRIADLFERAACGDRGMSTVIQSMKHDLNVSRGIGNDNYTIQSWLNYVKLSKSKVCSQGTMKCYNTAFDTFLKFMGKDQEIDISHVSRNDVAKYMESMLKRVRTGTVKRHTSCLCSAFSMAWDSEIIQRNPFSKLTPPLNEQLKTSL